MEILWFLIVGGIAGWLAGLIMKGRGFGIGGNIVVGVVGAVIGGLMFGAFGIGTADNILGSILVATLGAVVLLFLVNMFRRA
jgi:uncharacterized membrane protein YeaQ/YmgE (transglycosylase-associated protein family)